MADLKYLQCHDGSLVGIDARMTQRMALLLDLGLDFDPESAELFGSQENPYPIPDIGNNLVTCEAVRQLSELATHIFLNKAGWPAYEQQFKAEMVNDPRKLFFMMNAQHAIGFRPLTDYNDPKYKSSQIYVPLAGDNPFHNNSKVSDLMEYLFDIAATITEKLVEAGTSDDNLMQILGIPEGFKPTEEQIEKLLESVDTRVNKLVEQDKKEAELAAVQQIEQLQISQEQQS